MVSRNSANGATLDANLDAKEFQQFRDMLQSLCGIDLAQNKQYLVANRVKRILLAHQFKSLAELTRTVEAGGRSQLRQQVIDAMTTNETFWFRDSYPFAYLKNQLLPLHSGLKTGKPLRIWSAACSSGQEPYSISIAIEEYFRESNARRFPVEIVATDVSSNILERARSGVYDRLSVARGLSEERLQEFFTRLGDDSWRVGDPIRERVQFRSLNLQDSYFLLGKFDVIFCRNVLIYFSANLKRDILRKMYASMTAGGHLFLGSSEGLGAASDMFETIHCNPGVTYRVR